MTELLAQMNAALGFGWLPAFLVFCRVGAAMAILPAFGEQSIPQRLRLVIAFAFTFIVAPAATSHYPSGDIGGLTFLAFVAVEVIAGLIVGLSLRFFVIALQVAGTIAAQTTSLSQIFGGAGVDPQPAIGHILVIAGLALAVTLGLHVQIARFLLYSYEPFPPGAAIAAADLATWGTAHVARIFALAFSIAAPFVIASMIYNIALGAINRAMPQLMVSFVGAPAITLGGILLLLLTSPFMLATWIRAMEKFLLSPFSVAP